MAHGKKYKAADGKVDREKKYGMDAAFALLPELQISQKFDESVDMAIRLGVDPKHADQMVRGAVNLPHGTGKTVRVVVFAKGDKAKEAQDAGADVVGAEDLVEKIQKENWLDFDSAVSTPDLMGLVGRLGRVLGPRGLMPNPKVGTVTFDIGKAVRELKGGRVEFKAEKAGVVHARIGKISFGGDKLRENAWSLLELIQKLKPSSAKGTYMRSVAVSTTMSPSIKIDVNEIQPSSSKPDQSRRRQQGPRGRGLINLPRQEHGDGSRHDAFFAFGMVELRDERSIDLQPGYGQVGNVSQRRVAGSKVVDRKAYAMPCELRDGLTASGSVRSSGTSR